MPLPPQSTLAVRPMRAAPRAAPRCVARSCFVAPPAALASVFPFRGARGSGKLALSRLGGRYHGGDGRLCGEGDGGGRSHPDTCPCELSLIQRECGPRPRTEAQRHPARRLSSPVDSRLRRSTRSHVNLHCASVRRGPGRRGPGRRIAGRSSPSTPIAGIGGWSA